MPQTVALVEYVRHRWRGKLAKQWLGVKVPDHAQEVLDYVNTL